jgi:hypothetical protein
MVPALSPLLAFDAGHFRSRASPCLAHLALRHQWAVHQQTAHGPRLRLPDRQLRVWLSRLWSGWQAILVLVQPRTVIVWQQRFCDHRRRLSQRRLHPPQQTPWQKLATKTGHQHPHGHTAYVSRGVSSPVSALIRYEASRPDWLPAAKRNLPSGSRLKAPGTGSVATCPIAVKRRVERSTEKPAIGSPAFPAGEVVSWAALEFTRLAVCRGYPTSSSLGATSSISKRRERCISEWSSGSWVMASRCPKPPTSSWSWRILSAHSSGSPTIQTCSIM